MDDPLRQRVGRAVEALLAPDGAPLPCAADVPDGAVDLPVERFGQAELAARLRRSPAPPVVVVHRAGPRLRRALGADPPDLLVLTGPEPLDLGPEVPVLGPGARLRRGTGGVLVAAVSEPELAGYVRALGGALALGLAPTPVWWPAVALAQAARGLRVCAQVDVAGLAGADEAARGAWTRLAAGPPGDALWIPCGVGPFPPPDAPAPLWWSACIAGGLERSTGPVFPSPRVAAALLAPEPASEAPSWARALFLQAARALPELARAPGMDRPDPRTDPSVPAPAFLAQAVRHRMARAEAAVAAAGPPPPAEGDEDRVREVLAGAGTDLSEHESKVVLRAAGLSVTRQAVATSASGAVGFAERIGFPVALKVASPDLRRKQEIGAVALDLPTASAVRRAYAAVLRAVEARAPTARIDGVLVAEMVPPGLDLRVTVRPLCGGRAGLRVDLVSGPVRAAPVFDLVPDAWSEAVRLAHRVLVALEGRMRRADDPDPERLAPVFLRLGELWSRVGERLIEVDLDPLRWVPDRPAPVVLDARIRQRAHLEGA